ncbi:MAG: hypothetical protein Q6351_005080 [Candidatus Njordarchaeum guaymaensis]
MFIIFEIIGSVILFLVLFLVIFTWYMIKRRDLNIALLVTIYCISLMLILFYHQFLLAIVPITFAFLSVILLPFLATLKLLENRYNKKNVTDQKLEREFNLRNELGRKAFHLIAFLLYIPQVYLYTTYSIGLQSLEYILGINIIGFENYLSQGVLILLSGLIPLFSIIEFTRINFGKSFIPKKFIRRKEERNFAAYFYTTVAIFFISTIVSNKALITGIFVSLTYDLGSAIVGKAYGKRKILGDRTLEGVVGGLIIGFLLGFFLIDLDILIPALILVSFADIINFIDLNDNLLFPIVTALFTEKILLTGCLT